MDKAQKQLVDTYFRKRKIAVELTNNEGERLNELKPYEMRCGLISGILADYDFTYNSKWELIDKHPELLNKFDIKSLGRTMMSVLLVSHPEFLDAFKPYFNQFWGEDIARVLKNHPQFINAFDLSKLNNYDIREILRNQPQLNNKLNTSRLTSWDVAEILSNKPELADRFDLTKLNGGEIESLIRNQPQFADRFDLSSVLGKETLKKLYDFHRGLHPYLKKYFPGED